MFSDHRGSPYLYFKHSLPQKVCESGACLQSVGPQDLNYSFVQLSVCSHLMLPKIRQHPEIKEWSEEVLTREKVKREA